MFVTSVITPLICMDCSRSRLLSGFPDWSSHGGDDDGMRVVSTRGDCLEAMLCGHAIAPGQRGFITMSWMHMCSYEPGKGEGNAIDLKQSHFLRLPTNALFGPI